MRNAAKTLLAGLWLVCVYRAVTQSLVYDEALTHELYVLGPLDNIFHYFDPNHHFLNSVLMRLAAAIFGSVEWALRLPALAGAALYFIAVYRIARLMYSDGLLLFGTVALLSLNPFVLDFMVAARGYGMALGLLMFALALLLECFSAPGIDPKKLAWAGVALALSVTGNLIFALPVLAVAALTLYELRVRTPKPEAPKRETKRKPARASHTGWPPWARLIAPIAAIAFAYILAAPVENMRVEQFYTGVNTIAESLRSLAATSLQHSGPWRFGASSDAWRDIVAFGIAPAIAIAGLALGILRRDLVLLFATGPLVFSSAALVLMHFVLGRPYPADRTGIYFAPLVCLALAGLARQAISASSKLLAIPVYALGAMFLIQFATEFNTRKFWVWEYDADTRTMGEYIAGHRDPTAKEIHVGGSWQLSESLSYYLYRNQWTWMAIERRPPEPGFDYYMLIPQDASAVQAMGLKVVYRGPVSGSVLAVPAR